VYLDPGTHVIYAFGFAFKTGCDSGEEERHDACRGERRIGVASDLLSHAAQGRERALPALPPSRVAYAR
jgi:hypothetical protein